MEALQGSFGDAFATLPLLIMGFIFFLGMLTSNIGLLYLFIGHLVVVPAVSFLGNDKGEIYKSGQLDVTTLLKLLASLLIFFGINFGAGANTLIKAGEDTAKTSSGFGISGTVLPILFLILKFVYPTPVFNYINPMRLPFLGITEYNPTPGPGCNILPGTEDPYSSPSHWVNHLSFFFGFIMSNAVVVYNEPKPDKIITADTQADKKRNAAIDLRVSNRKSITVTIMILSIIIFGILLLFRYKKTGCENNFWLALVPLLIAYFTGFAFFSLIFTSCGVRPADVLGIVQGLIDTKLIDNPIVCVGST
jgi:hypothetical protein